MNQLKLLIRDILAGTIHHTGISRARSKDVATIVTFHRVLTAQQLAEYPLPGLAVTLDEFDWCLSYFRSRYTCDTVEKILGRYNSGERPKKPFLAVTFDDGQKDNFENAAPALQKHGINASFFVVLNAVSKNESLWHDIFAYRIKELQKTDIDRLKEILSNGVPELLENDFLNDLELHNRVIQHVKSIAIEQRLEIEHQLLEEGEPLERPEWDGMMSWDQLKSLVAEGHEIGSHTYSHPILSNCQSEQIDREVKESRKELAKRLDSKVSTFCYPNGSYNQEVVNAVKEAGYRYGITTRWGLNRNADDPLLLKRCDIQSHTSRSRTGALSHARLALRMSDLQPGL